MSSPTRAALGNKYQTLGLILLGAGALALIDLFISPRGSPYLRSLLGWGAIPFAGLLLFVGLFLTFRDLLGSLLGQDWYPEALLGFELVFVAGLAIAHLHFGTDGYAAARAGRGGGYVGWALSRLLVQNLNVPMAWVVLLAVALLGLVVFFVFTPLRGLNLRRLLPDRSAVVSEEELQPAQERSQPAELSAKKRPPRTRSATTPAPSETPASEPALDPQPSAPQSPTINKRRPESTQVRKQPAQAWKQEQPTPVKEAAPDRRKLPPLNLLNAEERSGSRNEQAAIQAAIIEDTLRSFDIPVKVTEINVGPTVTQFGIVPGTYQRNDKVTRVRVGQIVALADDLALALSASPVRIEAPVPGKPYVGIEVPNPHTSLVSLRKLLKDNEFAKVGAPLAIPLGRDVSGAGVVVDLHKLPHLLIAGATGSGKSVALNGIICGLLFNNLPSTLRLLLVDPKRVELPGYNGLPHLVAPVVTDPEHANGALSWLLVQMDDRYRLFSQTGVRNITSYNESVTPKERLPYIVLVIDELADLMMVAPEMIEAKLVRLAQMSRATGIHLIIATQRPSVDVVTGLIKANFPARLAFAVTSQIDSRVVLDTPGAEKLLGRGDGLLMTADSAKLRRIQGCFVSDAEIEALAHWWQSNYPAAPHDPMQPRYPWSQLMVEQATADDLLQQAIDKLRGRQSISVSGLQRLMGVGYPRAARLMEELEAAGVVGPEEDRRSGRPVLLDEEDLPD